MQQFLSLAAALLLGLPGSATAQGAPEHCWQSAVSLILSNDNETHLAPDTCRSACEAEAACIAWNFRPHSFDAESPGHCQLLGDVHRSEPSDRAFCGQVTR